MNYKVIIFSIMVLALSGCFYDDNDKNSEKVCCESYGFGSNMVKCCEKYEWSTVEDCSVPDNYVGGGKDVVDDSYCE